MVQMVNGTEYVFSAKLHNVICNTKQVVVVTSTLVD